MAICIYPQDCDDFSTNGLGVLTPISCKVTEESCGEFELELVQPIDPVTSRALVRDAPGFNLRWAQLEVGCIIKAPVPTRESPLYETEGVSGGLVTRTVWKVTGAKSGLGLFNKASGKRKKLAKLKNGALVNEIGRSGSQYKVVAQNGGKSGWVNSKYLTSAGTIQENVWNGQIIHPAGIQREQCREQLFRAYSVELDGEKGTATVKAMHISYDLRATLVNSGYNVEKKTVARTVLESVWDRLATQHEFELHIVADEPLQKKITGDYGWKNPIECMLDPDEGVLSQTGTLLLRDNYDLYVVEDKPRDSGVTIRRGKNLKAVKVTSDGSNLVTRIIPVGKTKDSKDLFLEGANYVDSPRINDYAIPYVQKIDYDVKVVDKDADGETTFKNATAARKKLRELAEADFADNGVDLPTYGMEVDFVLLQNSAEFAEYAGLQAVYLNDTVTVIDSTIGLTARVRVTGYEWDAIRCQYEKVTLGDVESLDQVVYSYNIPSGGVNGSKIAPGTLSGDALRDATIEYAKIAVATIEQLYAETIVALTARIQEIVAQKITTDELYAALGDFFTLRASEITAGTITTDELAAQLARIQVLIAGSAEFDQATIQHLLAEAMHLTFGEMGEVYIQNLAVGYAQMVGAAIGDLVIKASDGNYYHLDVDESGNISASQVTVTAGEASAGMTNAGEVILGTQITAQDLRTTNLLATFALINKIDAARIDVDELFARQGFIDILTTSRILGGRSLKVIAQEITETADTLAKWFVFDDERGLIISKPAWTDAQGIQHPASIWRTVTDEVGYHIYRNDMAQPVGSFRRDRLETQGVQVGDMLIKATSSGGMVWTDAE